MSWNHTTSLSLYVKKLKYHANKLLQVIMKDVLKFQEKRLFANYIFKKLPWLNYFVLVGHTLSDDSPNYFSLGLTITPT